MYDMDILQAELETYITHMSNVALCLDHVHYALQHSSNSKSNL